MPFLNKVFRFLESLLAPEDYYDAAEIFPDPEDRNEVADGFRRCAGFSADKVRPAGKFIYVGNGTRRAKLPVIYAGRNLPRDRENPGLIGINEGHQFGEVLRGGLVTYREAGGIRKMGIFHSDLFGIAVHSGYECRPAVFPGERFG